MTERTGTFVAAVVAPVALVLAAAVLHAREPDADEVHHEQLLYVRSGAVALRAHLSFDAIASDLYWIRAIQHYGEQRRSGGRFTLLEPLVNLATTLDPKFNIVYRFGAILIALDPPNGPGRPDQAISVLEKGLRANPDRWQYAHDIGFVHYWHTGRFDEAARWFHRAAEMPGAPRWLGPLSAVTLAHGGNREGARQLLAELAVTSVGYIRSSAERGLAQIQAADDLDRLNLRVRDYFDRTGRYPSSLSDVGSMTPSINYADPAGHAYGYDQVRGKVSLSAASPLSPLPPMLAPR